MPKLVGLNEKYKDKGLVMLFVGYESKAKLEAYAKKYNITWPIAIEPTKKAFKAYGARGYPSSYVIDPDGNIAWKGHPNSDELEDVINKLLPLVKNSGADDGNVPEEPTKMIFKEDLCRKLQVASRHASRGNLVAARNIAQKVLEDDHADAKEKEDAKYINNAINGRVAELFTKAEKLLKEKQSYEAREILDEIRKAFAGDEESEKARNMIEEIENNPDNKGELEAGRLFSKAMYHIERGRPSNAKNYLEDITEKYPDTSFAGKAKKELQKIEEG